MKRAMLRTVQGALALIVLSVAGVVVLVLVGALAQDAGVRIAFKVSAVIAACTVAVVAVIALLGRGATRA